MISKANNTKLNNVRTHLLILHKQLLTYQQQKYEKKFGRVAARRKLFFVVTNEPSFAWIRPLLELIVGLDGLISDKDTSLRNIKDLYIYTRKLLKPNRLGDKFSKQYFKAIQENPEVLITHHKVLSELAK